MLTLRRGRRALRVCRERPDKSPEVWHGSRDVQGDVASLADLDRRSGVVRDESGAIDILFPNDGGWFGSDFAA
jgi:hypothetical protein